MMRGASLQLDFRRSPSSPWRWFGWGLLTVAVSSAVIFSRQYAEIDQRHADLQSRADQLDERVRAASSGRSTTTADPQALADLRRANVIIDQLTVPWDDLFDALEAAGSRSLGVLSLTPNARDRTVRLAGESLSMNELLAYVDRLGAQTTLSRVHLLGYNAVQRDGVSVVSFTLSAIWRLPS